MTNPRISYDVPNDRMTRITEVMTKAMEDHAEASPTLRAMVFVADGPDVGMCFQGYEDMADATSDLLLHLKALVNAQGKTVDFGFLDENGVEFFGDTRGELT